MLETTIAITYISNGIFLEVPTKMLFRKCMDEACRDIHFEVLLDNNVIKSKASHSMEYAIAYLQKQLPEGIAIACCQSCRYGNFCPLGDMENEIFCFKGISADSREAILKVFIEKPDLLTDRSRNLLSICGAFMPINERNHYTYNSWNLKEDIMLDNKGFDQWSGEYDSTIEGFSKGYPFEGYYDVLAFVQGKIEGPQGSNILDVGVGTGLLTQELYKQGYKIYGLDFSEGMVAEARIKMPQGNFYIGDMKNGIPKELEGMTFDYIVSSYALHHLNTQERLNFLMQLKDALTEQGQIIIADVAFETRLALEKCRTEAGNDWDDDEYYIVMEELKAALVQLELKVNYTQVSGCAGVLQLKK